jgi:flagellar biosynthesis/type III secretory pathway chaperone
MPQTLNQLLATLDDEMKGYRDMQAVLSKERDAATRSDKDQLMHVCQSKQAIVQILKQTEERRQALVERLSSQYGVKERPLTVHRLCAHMEEPYATRLKCLAGDLKTQVETVRQANEANAKLFSHALELVHGSLKLINELIYSQAVYQKPGRDHRVQGYAGDRGRVFCGSV